MISPDRGPDMGFQPANIKRFERLRALSPLQAIEAWMTGDFGLGDEPALVEAIRKDTRVTLDDDGVADVIATAMDDGVSAAECLERLCGLVAAPETTGHPTINRCVVVVRPKQPFIDWAAALPDADDVLPTVEGEGTVYLIPSIGYPDDADRFLAELFGDIFDEELWAWHRARADWPANRDFRMFKEWFTIEVHSLVFDLCPHEPLEDE